jgi:hypothetical protein
MMRRLMWILWPAFLVAGIVEGITFSLFDPNDMRLFGASVHFDRMTVYSIGFFVFWAFAAASSALTCLLQRSPFEMSRCPLPQAARPQGCPRRG